MGGEGTGALWVSAAAASGERLIDNGVSAALAGRLIALQRRRLAESGVLDRRARRVLHDDVLPTGTAPAVALLGLVDALRQSVSDEWPGAFDSVAWEVAPAAATCGRALPPLIAEVLFYAAREAVRNAARYARPTVGDRPLHLRIGFYTAGGLDLMVEDDGIGLNGATSHGSGHGLALHSTLLAVVGGTLAVAGTPEQGTRVTLHLPTG
ncbi:MAG: hypothetical protein M3Z04_22120 [Chloroflexota bacterium]|nr:hypothetical protein [Chloroflexota bacterium]